MVHFPIPSLLVADVDSEEAHAADVEEEKNKRLESLVPDAVVRPWAVVVHLVDASIAHAAVMHAVNFLRTTFWALFLVFYRFIDLFATFSNFLPFLAIFTILVHILRRAEVMPLKNTWIVFGASKRVAPVR